VDERARERFIKSPPPEERDHAALAEFEAEFEGDFKEVLEVLAEADAADASPIRRAEKKKQNSI